MEDRAWHPGMIYEAWTEIHRALDEAMTPLPSRTLAFLAERAADKLIRDKAAEALDSVDNLTGAGDGVVTPEDLRQLFRNHPSG